MIKGRRRHCERPNVHNQNDLILLCEVVTYTTDLIKLYLILLCFELVP